MNKTIDLYTSTDVKNIREKLLKEQHFKCAITGEALTKDAILEHNHENLYVRGVASRQANSALGVIENLWKRFLKWWYPDTLPNFLRKAANYIEKHSVEPDKRFRHNSWLKAVKVSFKKLPAGKQDDVIIALQGILGKEVKTGKNSKSRLELFNSLALDRSLGFDIINSTIQKYSQKED